MRRRVLPEGLPEGLALHCAQEYTNIAALLPGLFRRFA
uniref:Unannotated protein n=1 Tax=freshwater metagenome TaxID=449393 RepID=A0A6J6A0R8_9ZZZZ